MPTLLSDPSPWVYVCVAACGLFAAATWLQQRRRLTLFTAAACGILLLLVGVCDWAFNSPREIAVEHTRAIIQAVHHRQPDECLRYVAETIEYHGDRPQPVVVRREQLRQAGFWTLLRQYNVRVTAWDFARDDVTFPDRDSVEIGFLVKAEGDSWQTVYYVRTRYTRLPDGQWRLSHIATFDPLKRHNERRSVPGFPP